MTKYILPDILKPKLKNIPNSDTILERNWITTNDLIYIYQTHLKDSSITLQDLTKNLQFYQEPIKPRNYDPEFQKQLDRLRVRAQEEEYQALINKNHQFGVDDKDNLTPAEMAREVKNQITTIFNVFLSVGSVAYAVWYWSNSSGYFSLSTRVLMSLFFAFLTLVAEVVMFNAFNRRVEEAKKKERKKKEVKKVVKTISL